MTERNASIRSNSLININQFLHWYPAKECWTLKSWAFPQRKQWTQTCSRCRRPFCYPALCREQKDKNVASLLQYEHQGSFGAVGAEGNKLLTQRLSLG